MDQGRKEIIKEAQDNMLQLPSRSHLWPVLTLKLILLGFCLTVFFSPPAPGTPELIPPHYPEDLAQSIISKHEIQTIMGLSSQLIKYEDHELPLFRDQPPPLTGVPILPNQQYYYHKVSGQWTAPPWAALPPSLASSNSPPSQAHPSDSSPAVWGSIQPYQHPAPSAQLRPRPIPLKPIDPEVPHPFSLRRYYTKDNLFVEIALYAGNTYFMARNDFERLQRSLTNTQPIQGLGEKAFMAVIPHPKSADKRPPKYSYDPNSLPFPAIKVIGPARPDLVDPGLIAAQSAPAFQDIPIDIKVYYPPPTNKSTAAVHTDEGNSKQDKPYASSKPIGPKINVIVFLLPSQDLTVSLAADQRLASMQSLIDLAMQIYSRLLNLP